MESWMFVKTYTFFHGKAPFYEYKHFSNTFNVYNE